VEGGKTNALVTGVVAIHHQLSRSWEIQGYKGYRGRRRYYNHTNSASQDQRRKSNCREPSEMLVGWFYVCVHVYVQSYVHTGGANAPTKNQKSFLEQCETLMNSCYSASLRHNMHVPVRLAILSNSSGLASTIMRTVFQPPDILYSASITFILRPGRHTWAR
jgi:hypothetical protein